MQIILYLPINSLNAIFILQIYLFYMSLSATDLQLCWYV